MSHKIRLNSLEKRESGNRLWALIGIGKPRDAQHQRVLEMQARQRFYASGGDREAYLAFLPFDSFPDGFYGYIKKGELVQAIANKTKAPGTINGTPSRWNEHLGKREWVCSLNRSVTCSYL